MNEGGNELEAAKRNLADMMAAHKPLRMVTAAWCFLFGIYVLYSVLVNGLNTPVVIVGALIQFGLSVVGVLQANKERPLRRRVAELEAAG